MPSRRHVPRESKTEMARNTRLGVGKIKSRGSALSLIARSKNVPRENTNASVRVVMYAYKQRHAEEPRQTRCLPHSFSSV